MVQMPMWPRPTRAMPNAFARSALFNVANLRKGDRENFKRREIASLENLTINYTGEELRQDDEDVFLQILHLFRGLEVGEVVKFTAFSILVELGWTKNSRSYQRLIDTIDRLKASSVGITSTMPGVQQNFSGSLIRTFRWREEGHNVQLREWEIRLEPEIVALFKGTDYSRLDWAIRLKLPPLAKWFHSFYHTHQHPLPYKVETFQRLTGSDFNELRKFRAALKKALELLVEVGFLKSYRVDPQTDLVHVVRAVLRPELLEEESAPKPAKALGVTIQKSRPGN